MDKSIEINEITFSVTNILIDQLEIDHKKISKKVNYKRD